MKRTQATFLALALTAVSIGHAVAADASTTKTREQVRSELAEAERTGDLVGSYTGEKLNVLYPDRYPAAAAVQGKTREQVRAELAEAERTGDLVGSYTGEKLNALYPDRYPAAAVVQGKTREQVKAERAQAVRSGTLPTYGGA